MGDRDPVSKNREQRRREAREARRAVSDVPVRRVRDPDPAWRPMLEGLVRTFEGVDARTLNAWEEELCRVEDPDAEMAFWALVAERFRREMSRREYSPAERAYVFDLVQNWSRREPVRGEHDEP